MRFEYKAESSTDAKLDYAPGVYRFHSTKKINAGMEKWILDFRLDVHNED